MFEDVRHLRCRVPVKPKWERNPLKIKVKGHLSPFPFFSRPLSVPAPFSFFLYGVLFFVRAFSFSFKGPERRGLSFSFFLFGLRVFPLSKCE